MKDYRIELRWGILISLVSAIWMFVEKNFLNWHDQYIGGQFMNHLLMTIIIFLVMLYLALKEKRKYYYKGKISWKRAFVSGMIVSVFVALLSPLIEYFNYNYISPDYFKNMIEYQTNKEKFPMTRENAEKIFNMKSFIFQGIFTSFSFGIFISALAALFVRTDKKKEKDFFKL